MRAKARDTPTGSHTFLTCMKAVSSGQPGLILQETTIGAGFSTHSAVRGLNSSRMSLRHRQLCDLVQGVSTLITSMTFPGTVHTMTSQMPLLHLVLISKVMKCQMFSKNILESLPVDLTGFSSLGISLSKMFP